MPNRSVDREAHRDGNTGFEGPSEPTSSFSDEDPEDKTEYNPPYGTLGSADNSAKDRDHSARRDGAEDESDIGWDELKKAMGPSFSPADENEGGQEEPLDPDDPMNTTDRL